MEAPGGPPRFKCPLDFSASPFCPGAPFSQETLQDPSKELWLIRAPASFSPESLEGHSVPLLGFQTLKVLQPGGTEKIFHVQRALEHLGGADLLLPSGPGGHLTSLPFSGSLSVCERYGDPGSNQPLFPVAARPAPWIPAGLKQRFLPFGNQSESAPLPGTAEEPPRKKKKTTTKKQHQAGEEGDSKDRLPLFGVPLGETTGAGETEAEGQYQLDGAAPLAVGSAADAQDSVLSVELEDLALLSKKKKKKKRKEDREVKQEEMGEIAHQHEDGAAPLATDSQPSSAADAPDSLFFGEAEDLALLSKKKKKKKRKEEREVKQEEIGGEGEIAHQQEDGASPLATDSQPSSAADAQNSVLSVELEDLALLSKKKKKKRKEEREVKQEEMRGEGETVHQHEGGAAPLATDSQPSAQNSLLFGEAEDLALLSKKKKKRKEDREVKEEEMGREGEIAYQHENGASPLATDSQPGSVADAQNSVLSLELEDLALLSKKKKKKRKEEREGKEEVEARCQHEGDGTAGGAVVSQEAQPDSAAFAHGGGFLSGEAEADDPRSKKKKKRKEGREVKEEAGGAAEGLPGLSSGPERDSLPGMAEAPPEPFSSQEEAAGVLPDFRGLGLTPGGGLVLAEEELRVGSSGHKAKKRKKGKEKPEEEAAQGLEGWPGQQGVESQAEPGTSLGGGGGGGGGQEAESGREELSQKRKRKKEHRRRQAAEEGLAGLEEEVGPS